MDHRHWLFVHLVGVFLWMSGMFGLLGALRVLAESPAEQRAGVLSLAGSMRTISSIAMIVAWAGAIAMLVETTPLMKQGWVHGKLTVALLLSGGHGFAVGQFKKAAKGEVPETTKRYRIAHMVLGTLALVAIGLAVFQPGV